MNDKTFTLTVPVQYKKNGQDQTSYHRVGAAFVNERRDGSGQFLSIKLDFPVAVTELVAFPMTDREDDNNITE